MESKAELYVKFCKKRFSINRIIYLYIECPFTVWNKGDLGSFLKTIPSNLAFKSYLNIALFRTV